MHEVCNSIKLHFHLSGKQFIMAIFLYKICTNQKHIIMTLNIVDIAKSMFSRDFTSNAANQFGESESSVDKFLSAGIPTILAGFLSKSETTDGANTIHKAAVEAEGSGILGNLGSLFARGAANSNTGVSSVMNLISKLFGERWSALSSLIANYSGVKQGSASGLLGLIVPVILGALGKQVKDNNLSASGLASWLLGQKENIVNAAPSGFNLASALGLSSLGSLGLGAANMASGVKRPVDTTTSSYSESETSSGGNKWLLPLLILLALGALVWYFMKGKKVDDTVVATDTMVTTPVDNTATTTTTTTTRTLTEVSLPNGTKLQAYPGGIEDQLIQFIQSDEYRNATNDQLKERWFNFDDLNFEFGTTTLTAESQRQLDNIAAILKAFPDAKIKVGGYTDKKGDDAQNKKLSDDRAKAVKKALTDAGVGAQVPEAEGYGEEFATVDENASDEERLADRKTAVRLIK